MKLLICQIFRSPRREEMYLYVDRDSGLEAVPESLLATFGEPVEVMQLPLDAGRKLARADAAEVLASIAEKGFFLQMPPAPGSWLRRERDHGQ